MVEEKRRKPRPPTQKPYARKNKDAQKPKDAPKTSAQPAKSNSRANLTLHDWLTVVAFVNAHPAMSQAAIVQHFATLADGALLFSQAALSRKLKPDMRAELDRRSHDHANALSSKHVRVVTRPDVDRALILWVRHMEGKGEVVNGPMLSAKRANFEEAFKVPAEERLKGDGWIQSFCKAHKLKEQRRHGEAGSVDLKSVEAEHLRVYRLLYAFHPRDRWNFDETSFFVFATPDRGLATQKMSGKKQNKFRLSLGFACNSDGSEKRPAFFIGKSKQPRCFKGRTATSLGFYYRNNKTSWMTSEFFEEWIQKFDVDMRLQNRRICLTVDNFSGHSISYTPQNIKLEFFEPNLTSFVQPLDQGIIRCFKAIYRRELCIRALELDEAGEEDIYKLDLLEAMVLARRAWREVTAETMANCWKHSGIVGDKPPQGEETILALFRSTSDLFESIL
ncbi:hypothetical protein EUX98_g9379 [Antrodiella citrinella]|uniref:HTH CENPB-type domain-containing protein n=1 Tax=Antrodiella citrinella TaxID=2447956 RepID=A0A4S4LVW8_9APHY|nr:hypothetical protein EUX98_g9379 [Antrodiella citrinella]